MKNLLTATLPGLALLALGGCATSGALTTSTETDGVYYSSSDHTTAVAAPVYSGNGSSGNIPARALDDTVPVAAATTDDANPDYQGGTTQGYATGTDYYSNSYNDGLSTYTPNGSGFNQPYAGPGVSSYNYNPGWSVAPSFYGSPFGYGAGMALGYGYSPYSMGGFGYPYGGGFYDPFYSPYYSPYGFGYGSGLSIGFGYGFGGFGGFGYPYGGFGGYPYGYGYGGGYGRGYYAGGYDGYSRPIIYTRGGGTSTPGAGAVIYGSRSNRGGAVMNARNVAGNPNTVNVGGGRPSPGSYTGNAVALPAGNNALPGGNAPMPMAPTGRGGRAVSFGGDATGQPTYSQPASQPTGNTQPAGAPSGGRRGFFSGFFGNPAGGAAGQPAAAGQPTSQPMNNGGYGARQRSGSYGQAQSQGQMQQRSYSQPTYSQPQRTYSQPQQQMQQPSRSFGGGNFGGGGGGGGSFGGGGGGGGGRGRR
jgi:hypothetical protein